MSVIQPVEFAKPRHSLREFLDEALGGHVAACALVMELNAVVEAWDDIIDGDADFNSQAINEAFFSALINLPRNTFYRDHFAVLNPLIESAILDWHAANKLEASKVKEMLRQAYVMRCSIYNVLVMCARIIGGVDHACKVNVELRSMGDTWTDYKKKHGVS